jgi:tetratricopeptide (TPR) repeat protein
MENSLLAFVGGRLAAVFKSGEVRHCWKRVALIVGHALARHIVLPRRERLPEDVAETLGDALEPCAVDAYLTIDGEIPTLSIHVAQLALKRELNILSPLADTETIDAARKTAEGLAAKWRSVMFTSPEAFYALGLAALAAGVEVDNETADLLLYAASAAVQVVAHLVAVSPILATLRPLGEKAPHRYVHLLAAASELEPLDRGTVEYIYDALQQLKDRLLETERLWSLVEAVSAYSNLLRNHSIHIMGRWKEAVADMCMLYGEVRGRSVAATLESGLSAQRLFNTVAGAYVLAVALRSDDLTPLVQDRCGLGDIVKETEAVKSVLDEAAAHLDELRKIVESDADFAEWVTALSVTGDAGGVVEGLRTWFTYELTRYKLNHAIDERGELDAGKLEEAAKEFEKAAEMNRKLKLLENYLATRSWALRARVLAANSWEELLERAEGFRELWREAEKHLEPAAVYLATAAGTLGECLVYLAASGDRKRAEDLLKERRRLLDYDPRASVTARLMLRLFGVGEGARQEEVVDVFKSLFLPEFQPALSMLAGRLQRDKAHKECGKLFNAQPPKAELCDIIVAAAAGDRVAAEILRSVIEKVAPEARPLLDRADGKTLVEVSAINSLAQFAFMLLAAVEGRADAVRLHGLWGSAGLKEPLPQRLFRAVYESCGDLNSEGCRLALLKLCYYHF